MNLDVSGGFGPHAIPVPEPGLTPAMLFERAVALRGLLRDEQDAADERGT